MPRDDGLRFDDLSQRVLAPVVLGGPLHPLRPFGVAVALRIGVGREIVDSDLRTRIDVARVRRARLLAPINTLPDLDAPQWALVAALNDLLQVTNHELGGPLSRRRYAALLASVRQLCERVPPPRDVGAALARHATFARVLELARTDSRVSWWTGSARFRGEKPPARLMLWQKLRRVEVETKQVPLAEMCASAVPIPMNDYLEVVARWLACTPLTDIATLSRAQPVFRWSRPTLALIATAPGRTLAWRALHRQPLETVIAATRRAAAELPADSTPARELAEAFASDVAQSGQRSAVSGPFRPAEVDR